MVGKMTEDNAVTQSTVHVVRKTNLDRRLNNLPTSTITDSLIEQGLASTHFGDDVLHTTIELDIIRPNFYTASKICC